MEEKKTEGMDEFKAQNHLSREGYFVNKTDVPVLYFSS